jgi:hypothetical protein
VFQIPIGYASGYTNGNSSLTLSTKPSTERKYISAFIGSYKSDRKEMCSIFESNFSSTYMKDVSNTWDISTVQIPPSKIFEIYSDSTFVPVGRGNSSLECFRIYEAIVAGAIPVIVGSMEEVNHTFFYNGSGTPPFLFAPTWNEAVIRCKEYLSSPQELLALQEKNRMWWRTMLSSIQEKIQHAL